MKTIKVENSLIGASVNDEDFEFLQGKGPWRVSSEGYVYCGSREGRDIGKMHLMVMDRVGLARKGVHVDHKNFDKMDMTRGNLRVLSIVESLQHKRGKRG